jgi:hypothetical protein
VRFTAEIVLDVEVQVLDATAASRGQYLDRPEACYPAEGEEIALAVWLGDVDLVDLLPADVREALEADAVERLRDDPERCV